MTRSICSIAWLGLLVAAAGAGAQASADQVTGNPIHHGASFRVARTTTEIKVDGTLNEDAWRQATPIPLDFEYSPGNNVRPPVKTDCFMTYDDRNLYIGCKAYDPQPKEIRAHYMQRDNISIMAADDHISVLVDAFNDQRRALEFRVNPLGAQVDGTWSEVRSGTGLEDLSLDLVWSSAGQITEEGYTVEMAIPFNQIQFPREGGAQTWGVSLSRNYPRVFRYRISSHPRDRNVNCVLCQDNPIVGFEHLNPGLNLELDPAVVANRTDTRPEFPTGGLRNGSPSYTPGLNFRWGVTPSLEVNGAIKPDYSQLDLDLAPLSLNERFPPMLTEKRPLFLQEADIFSTPLTALYTRSVIDPQWGARAAGRLGENNVLGASVTDDNVNTILLPGAQSAGFTTVREKVTSEVARYRRDLGESSTFGVLYTGREATDYHNRVGGFDGFFRLSPVDDLQVQYLHSNTLYPTAVANQFALGRGALGGDAGNVRYQHLSRDWFAFLEYTDVSPSFRADSGFVPQIDYRTYSGNLLRRFFGGRDNWWTLWTVAAFHTETFNHQNVQLEQTTSLFTRVQGPQQSSLQITARMHDQRFNDATFHGLKQLFWDFRVQPAGVLSFKVIGQVGQTVDFVNTRRVHLLEVRPTFDLKLTRRITAQVYNQLRTLSAHDRQQALEDLTEARVFYHFNTRLFARAIVQFRHISRAADLYVVPVDSLDDGLNAQYLLTYIVNSRANFYLGYADERDAFNQFNLTQKDRSFFFKVGYALVL
jgi:Carbohydrate family 9 binding domain-like